MRYIIPLLSAGLIILLAFSSPKKFVVTGKVTNANGEALAGITVLERDHKNTVTTGPGGIYAISLSSKNGALTFSGNGYTTTEVPVKGRGVIDIALETSTGKPEPALAKEEDKVFMNVEIAPIRQQGLSSKSYETMYKDEKTEYNREGYDNITENRFKKVSDDPLSTFSIDVDAASYSNVRRFLNTRQLPPAGAVRIEEMVNYFHYDYPQPTNGDPFSINTEIAVCPWNSHHRLAVIGLQGKKIPVNNLPSSNLVFLIDVSGSMMEADKLPLVQQSLKLLADNLRERDKVYLRICRRSGNGAATHQWGSKTKDQRCRKCARSGWVNRRCGRDKACL